MLLSGDLGFPSPFLLFSALASVFFAAIGLVARHKWRLALAREEEVKRLLILASEESARAELEALSMYSSAPRPPSPSYPLSLCAVCFSPTNTRCARCKAVRYCSGKCQIIHWRQGHKEDCCPPKTDCQNNDKGSNFCHNAAKQEDNDNCELDREKVAKPFEEPALSNSTPSFKLPYGGDGDSKAKHLSDGSETSLINKSAHASISNSATLSSESFHDASDGDGEFSSTTHPESSEETKCVGVLSDIHETPTSTSSRNHQTEPKFPVTQIVSDTSLNSCTFTDSSVGETHIGSETSLDANSDGSDGGSCANPSKSSPSFLKETLEPTKRPNSDNEKINLGIAGDGNSYEAGAFKEFSFNLSGYAIPLLSLDSEVKPVAVLAANNPIDGVAVSNHNSKGISEDNNFPSVTSENCSQIGCDPVCDLDISKPKVVASLPSEYHTLSRTRGNANTIGSLGASGSSKLIFERPKFVDGSLRSTSHLVTSERAGSYSNDVVDDRPSSKDLNDKLGKFDVNHGGAPNLRYPPNVSNGLKTSVLKVVDHIRPSKSSKQYSEGGICEVSKRYGEKGLFSYEMFVKLYHWKKVELQPCGLTNCGNSCYANVVLQCLAFTPPLTAFHLQGFHSKACEKKEWCFTCEFERLILKAKEGRSPLSPIGILSQVGKISSQLISGKEEDAHEFLRYVIDTMQSIYLKEAGTNRLKVFGEETTLIGLTFGGYLRSKIKCMKCRGKSEQNERMMDLTVEIEGDIGSLEEALRKFTSTEILDGKNKYSCSRCKSYERAKKKFTVLEAPNVLTIALKRFQSGKFGKLNKSIRFPEILDLAPYMSGTGDKSPIYSLYGVVVHLDIMNAAFSGHYVCYVKNIQSKWFKIDDSTVKAVDRETVLSKGAYMLLYARCSPRAPRSIRNALTSHEVKNPLPKFPTPYPSWIPSDVHMGRTGIRCLDADSSSDNSSLISGSDEGSCSTESSRDSTSTSDFSDYIFGDLGGGWNSPYRGGSSDSDTSSLYSRPLWHTDLDRYASSSPKSRPQNVEGGGVLGRRVPGSISRPEDSGKR